MCLTFLYVSPDDDCGKYQLVLINNRDESYQRPTANASFWTKDILCSELLFSVSLGSSFCTSLLKAGIFRWVKLMALG